MGEKIKEIMIEIENIHRKMDENILLKECDIQSLIKKIRELKKILRHNN